MYMWLAIGEIYSRNWDLKLLQQFDERILVPLGFVQKENIRKCYQGEVQYLYELFLIT